MNSRIEPPKRTFYIHIGMSKTATSTLQEFFWGNRSALAKQGILYPDKGRLGPTFPNHFRLFFCFREGKHFLSPTDIDTPEQEWGRVMDEVAESDLDVLVSCEAFVHLTVEQFQKVKSIIGDDFQVKLILYLRRLDKYAVSWLSQKIKRESRKSKRLNLDEIVKVRLDLYNKLPPLVELFGHENIIVRPFERKSFYNNDIVYDFLYYGLNITNFDSFNIKEEQINPALGKFTLEYKLLVNGLDYDLNLLGEVGNALEKYSLVFAEEPATLLSKEQASQLLDSVSQEERWLAENLFPDLEELFADASLPADQGEDADYQLSTDRTIEISEFLLNELLASRSVMQRKAILDLAVATAARKGGREKEVNKHLVAEVIGVILGKKDARRSFFGGRKD